MKPLVITVHMCSMKLNNIFFIHIQVPEHFPISKPSPLDWHTLAKQPCRAVVPLEFPHAWDLWLSGCLWVLVWCNGDDGGWQWWKDHPAGEREAGHRNTPKGMWKCSWHTRQKKQDIFEAMSMFGMIFMRVWYSFTDSQSLLPATHEERCQSWDSSQERITCVHTHDPPAAEALWGYSDYGLYCLW